MPFANDCVDQGYKSVRDIKSVEIDQCTTGDVDFVMIDPRTGGAIDLTEYGITDSTSYSSGGVFTGVKVTIKELPEDAQLWGSIIADVVSASDGQITIPYEADGVARRAGIFTAQAEIWEDDEMRRFIPLFFIVNPSVTHDPADRGLTLSIAEIRMTIRDTDPEGNYLLEQLDFTRNEIALMIRRCIDYWNEVPPPVAYYKPTNFPWRYHLSLGVAALLHQMAANQKMRNDLPYQAGGLTIQDTIKFQQYLDFYQRYWQQWAQWVKDKKYQINIGTGFQVLSSGYGRYHFYR